MSTLYCFAVLLLCSGVSAQSYGSAAACPKAARYGSGPPSSCKPPADPNNKPPSKLESWFTKQMFEDLFPQANIGWGPNACWPYSYESFIIAARYFPEFGTSTNVKNTVYTAEQNMRRDLAALFAHAIQETGENNIAVYDTMSDQDASNCFYRGGFYNWFEGGPVSSFLDSGHTGSQPSDGYACNAAGLYCSASPEITYFYPCSKQSSSSSSAPYQGCYFGRGAIQISYNFNYGQFQKWLQTQNIHVDLLNNPNLIMTMMNPPLAIMSSMWFYMTPQPPKPAMHDIVMGNWNAGSTNTAAGYSGPIFGPTSLIINDECGGEDAANPGGPGESRRIKAFKWFCGYFGVPTGADNTLSCKGMPQPLAQIKQNQSWQPDWSTTWMNVRCNCAPASYGGMIPYFEPGFYPDSFIAQNSANQEECVKSIYANPSLYSMDPNSSPCLNVKN